MYKLKLFKNKFRINSVRLKGYDYSLDGGYFITICTKDREYFFGDVIDGEMILNDCGKIVYDEILNTRNIRKNIMVDEFIVMPNHLHLILNILSNINVETHCLVETHCNVSLQKQQQQKQLPYKNKFGPQINNLGSIIRGLKGGIKNKINTLNGNQLLFSWQKNYYEHIIRSEPELNKIRQYIIDNPKNWESDRNNIKGLYI